jgi:hypothetical protein
VRCRIIGSHEQIDENNYRAVPGVGPNVGRIVTIVKFKDESPNLGNVWECDAGTPCIVLYWGSIIQVAHFSEYILEPIEDDPLPEVTKETEKETT